MLKEELADVDKFGDFLIDGLTLCFKEVPQTPMFGLLFGLTDLALLNKT